MLFKEAQEIITGQVPYVEYKNEHGVYRALDKKSPPICPKELAGSSEREKRMWRLLIQCWDHDPMARPKARKIFKTVCTSYSFKLVSATYSKRLYNLLDSGFGHLDLA
jgi:hypothetical protein